MCVTSSDAIFFKIVVLPALSNPNNRILNSLSGDDLNFRRRDNKP